MIRTGPIALTPENVALAIAGAKTHTRRKINKLHPATVRIAHNGTGWAQYDQHDFNLGFIKCPHDKDILWVQESYRLELNRGEVWCYYTSGGEKIVNLTDRDYGQWQNRENPSRKQPGRFMYRSCSRYDLKVNQVYPQKLSLISEQDAIKEGVQKKNEGWRNYLNADLICMSAVESFKTLWASIHGKNQWEGIWVWVIDFKTHTPKDVG